MKAPKTAGYGSYKRGKSRAATSYTAAVTGNARKKSSERLNEKVVLLLLCALLPPVGVYMLWRDNKYGTVFSACGSALACVMLYLLFTAVLPARQPEEYPLSKVAPAAVTEYATAQE